MTRHHLGYFLLTSLVVVGIVIGSSVATPRPDTAAAAVGKGSAVTKQVRALKQRVKALEKRQTPTTLPPNGPAGGVLSGTYPNPSFVPNSIGTNDLATGGVESADLAASSVGGFALKGATAVVGTGVPVGVGETKTATVTCPQGSRLLGGGLEWSGRNTNGTAVISSSPTFTGDPNTTWEVAGRVDIGGAANTVFAEALCLAN